MEDKHKQGNRLKVEIKLCRLKNKLFILNIFEV